MELNADFDKRVVLHGDSLEWQASPMAGVDRRMLDRLGDEVARATSIVRYAPGSHFSAHVHHGGEEFIVLDGVFQDEHGDYPVGSYVRNPPLTQHTPGSETGCTIFVKLWQFDPADREQVNIDLNTLNLVPNAETAGLSTALLFEDAREKVQLEAWAPGAQIRCDLPDGAEFLVLDGTFTDGADQLVRHSWLRVPRGSQLDARAGNDGATVWAKYHHLRFVDAPV